MEPPRGATQSAPCTPRRCQWVLHFTALSVDGCSLPVLLARCPPPLSSVRPRTPGGAARAEHLWGLSPEHELLWLWPPPLSVGPSNHLF